MPPKIIGLTGKQEAGKTTAAKYLRERYGYAGSNLTDPMDEMLTPLMRRMGVPEHEILPRLNGTMKNVPIDGFEWLTGRKLKQAMGREFRDAVSRPYPDGSTDRGFFHDLWKLDNDEHPLLIHEQVRYDFEADLIRRDGGVVYEIYDPEGKHDDPHESEKIGFPVEARISNPKIGLESLHAALDAIMDVEPSTHVQLADAEEPLAAFDAEVDSMLNNHGPEIRRIADRVDEDTDLSDEVDDVMADIKGHLGTRAANQASDAEAIYAIEAASAWVTDNISNSTSDRRVAAVYAFLGVQEARVKLGEDA